MSASTASRGHPYSVAHARAVLTWVERGLVRFLASLLGMGPNEMRGDPKKTAPSSQAGQSEE